MATRFLSILTFLICLLNINSASADYPDYLNGDRNFILSGGHMGMGWFIDRSTIKILLEDYPIVIIAGRVVTVNDADRGNTVISDSETRRYLYNQASEKMYALDDYYCYYISPVGSMAETGHEFSGEMFFYIAYDRKFYGGKQWWYEYENRYRGVNFSDRIYEIIDAVE